MNGLVLFSKNIYKYRKYIVGLAKSELKSEVTDSYLNWFWWIIEPLASSLIYIFVFGYIYKSREEHFIPFVLIGITMWTFFNRMIKGSVRLIVLNRELIKKVYIPKYVLLISKSLTYLFKMAISFAIAFIAMIITKVPLTWNTLYFIPIVIIFYLLTLALGCILMHYGVYVQDLSNLMDIVMKLMFYVSGVFYNIKVRLAGTIQFILLRFNPVAFILYASRNALLYNKAASLKGLGFYLIVALVLLMIGIHLIHKYENSYAKVI